MKIQHGFGFISYTYISNADSMAQKQIYTHVCKIDTYELYNFISLYMAVRNTTL